MLPLTSTCAMSWVADDPTYLSDSSLSVIVVDKHAGLGPQRMYLTLMEGRKSDAATIDAQSFGCFGFSHVCCDDSSDAQPNATCVRQRAEARSTRAAVLHLMTLRALSTYTTKRVAKVHKCLKCHKNAMRNQIQRRSSALYV